MQHMYPITWPEIHCLKRVGGITTTLQFQIIRGLTGIRYLLYAGKLQGNVDLSCLNTGSSVLFQVKFKDHRLEQKHRTLLDNSKAASAATVATSPSPATSTTQKTAAVKMQLRHILITTLEGAAWAHSKQPLEAQHSALSLRAGQDDCLFWGASEQETSLCD